jgi:hypothetical protein
MARTTVDIDGPVLRELKALQKKEKASLGKIISRLLAEALSRRNVPHPAPKLKWVSRPMGELVDLTDKEAVYAALDREEP